jgi:hypothetical protein
VRIKTSVNLREDDFACAKALPLRDQLLKEGDGRKVTLQIVNDGICVEEVRRH